MGEAVAYARSLARLLDALKTGAPEASLKTELVHHRRYRTRSEAAREIAEYIDLFYNRERRQARLGYLSPVAYTQLFTRQRAAA